MLRKIQISRLPSVTIYGEKTKAAKIMKELNKQNGSYLFTEPVDPVKLEIPDYFDVVETPMDFSTVNMKL